MTNKLLRIKSDVRGQLLVETVAAQTTWRSKVCVALLTVVVIMCTAMGLMGATVTWEAPSSVKVGQTFYVHARVDGIDASNHVGVDPSKSSGSVWEWDAAAQWKAASAGTVTFYVQYYVGSQRKESTRTVTIIADTPTPPSPSVPTLGSVNLEMSSTSVVPGETVTCSLSAYSTAGASITSGTKSWSISSITNDSISSSGVLTIAPVPVSRTVTVTGTYSYNGVTKSATKTVDVVPIVVQTPTIEPADGTVIGDSQSVLISCEDADALVYYTIDGTEPPDGALLYQRRFRVSGKVTVKAVAIQGGKANSEVAVAHYALGQCPDPVIVSAGGGKFTTDESLISISWDCEDGVLRYTLDGSDVTETSPEYTGAFTIDKTTTIKAKAFGETYFDSKQIELMVRVRPRIIDVKAQQRYPWNGKVDITVTFSGMQEEVANMDCSFVATNNETLAALSVSHVVRNGGDNGSGNVWTRRYVWDSVADIGAVLIKDAVLTVEIVQGGVRLWKNGPYWAECNVGASKPEEYGDYFWWGDTVGYKYNGSCWDAVDGSRTGFSFSEENCSTQGKSISQLQTEGYIDDTGNLVMSYDAATAYLGGPWRMPTGEEIDELINNCDSEWSMCNGVYGRYLKGRGEFSSKKIFFPAAGAGSLLGAWEPGSFGRYWSSSPDSAPLTPDPGRFGGGRNLCFGVDESPSDSNDRRESGQNVRPVREATPTVGMSTHLALDNQMDARVANLTERICFSPTWETISENATVTVTLDGVVVTNATETGSFEWMPTRNGTYQFSHTVFTNGVPVGEVLEATFVVNGFTPAISPRSGTIFESSLPVMMECPFANANIYYTHDGSEPTVDSQLYQGQIYISGKTTVKAIAAHESEVSSEVVVAHYALGQCPDPVIVSAGGETFSHGNMQITVDWECADGVLRYTTDGSDVTETSPEYVGPFTIDETTTIKAKAFGETYFDSKQVELTVTREWELVATPVISAAESFAGSKTVISIACATEDATIRYTTDGSEPNAHSRRYAGPFEVSATTVVKAYATLADYTDSEVVTKTITKVWGIGDSVGLPDHAFTTDGDAEWVNDGGVAMRSGTITHEQVSVMRSTFIGKGRLTFELKTSCEEDLPQYMEYDRAEVWLNGALKMKQDGEHDWKTFEFDLDGASTTVEWWYVKDEMDDAKYPGEDCIWVRNIVWMPELTCTTEVPVELGWIREKFGDLGSYYYDYEDKAKEIAANGHKVWECYVAGEDPTNKDSRFTAIVKIGADGKPILSWNPPLNGETSEGAGIREGVRSYRVYGKRNLDDVAEEWTLVSSGNEGDYRFFKVGVAMP